MLWRVQVGEGFAFEEETKTLSPIIGERVVLQFRTF